MWSFVFAWLLVGVTKVRPLLCLYPSTGTLASSSFSRCPVQRGKFCVWSRGFLVLRLFSLTICYGLLWKNHHLWIGECWAIYSISSQITSLILIVVTELLVILRTSPAKSCPAAFNFWSWNRSRCHRNCARRFWGRPAAHGAPKALRISALGCGWY